MDLASVKDLVDANIRAATYDLGTAERTIPYLKMGKEPMNFQKWNQKYYERAANVNAPIVRPGQQTSGASPSGASPSGTAAVPTATGPNGQKLYLRNGAWVAQ